MPRTHSLLRTRWDAGEGQQPTQEGAASLVNPIMSRWACCCDSGSIAPPVSLSKLCAHCNTRPCHQEANGKVHPYCGRACANAAASRQTSGMCVRCGIRPVFAEAGRSHQYCGKACRDQADGVVVPAQRTVPLDERGPHALLPHEIRFYEKGDDFYEFTNFWECDKLVIDGQRWRTTEHYFQAMKFAAFPQLVEQCRNLATPRECFEMVRDPALAKYLLCNCNTLITLKRLIALSSKIGRKALNLP